MNRVASARRACSDNLPMALGEMLSAPSPVPMGKDIVATAIAQAANLGSIGIC